MASVDLTPTVPVTQQPKKAKGSLTNEDVLMTHVAPCLSYMDLFSLVRTTEQMALRLTHEHSLTAVLCNADDKFGKNAKTTIRDVMGLYGEGNIHKPSPMRLLRLANGKRCEFGPPCDTREARNVVKTRPDWGLFCCWPHTVGGSVELSHSKKTLAVWGGTIQDPRTCQHQMSNKTFIWKQPAQANDGEAIGPIVTTTTPHDGSTPDAALFQLFQRLDREGREHAQAVSSAKAARQRATKASKEQKVAAIEESVKKLAGDVQGVIGCRALVERLDPYYLAPSKTTPSKLKAIVDDVKGAYAAADAALGSFSFLDESNLRDAVLKKALSSPVVSLLSYRPDDIFGPGDFLRYASRGVLDLAAAGRLREALVLRLHNQAPIAYAKRQSQQVSRIRSMKRASPERLQYAFKELVGGKSDHHRRVALSAWYLTINAKRLVPAEPTLVEPLVRANSLDEAIVSAARDLYERALAAAREVGQRIDAARSLEAGTGESFLLSKLYNCLEFVYRRPERYADVLIELGSTGDDAKVLGAYDKRELSVWQTVHEFQ